MRSILDPVPTILMYAFALDGLYVLERERDSRKIWGRRIPKAISPGDPALTDRLSRFLGEVFWLRSKAAHGVLPIRHLERRSREVETQGLFLPPLAFNPLLVNLREIVRRSIRFFIDRRAEGVRREDALAELDR